MRKNIPDFESLEQDHKFDRSIGIIAFIAITLILLAVKETRGIAVIFIIAALVIAVVLKAKESKKAKETAPLPDREIRCYICNSLEKQRNYDSDLGSDRYNYYAWLNGRKYKIDSLIYDISRIDDVFITAYSKGRLLSIYNAREYTVSDSMRSFITCGKDTLEQFEDELCRQIAEQQAEQQAKKRSEKEYWDEIDRVERKFNIGAITEEEKALRLLKAENKKKYYNELNELKAQLKNNEITDEEYKKLCDKYVLEGIKK